MPSKHSDIRDILVKAAAAGLNVLLEGPHGTGKTALITSAANQLGLKMKYYSASTLDPFVDLVGLPVPSTDDRGEKGITYHRHQEITGAELVFFDELNRAQSKVLNAILEMIQFRSINGEKLPRLQAIFAACNPASDAYDVVDLDPALVDRFHIHMTFDPGPDRDWFADRFGKKCGSCLYDWWAADLDQDQQRQVSPRELEHIGSLLEHELSLDAVVTPRNNLPFAQLYARLREKEEILDISDFINDPEKYEELVERNMNVAVRFTHLLPMMKPGQMCRVSGIILSLPVELLATLKEKCPFVFSRTQEAIKKCIGPGEAQAFKELIDEKMAV